MLNNFSSKCVKMTKRYAFGTGYSITYFNSGIKVRPSLGKACTNLCHVFGFVISTPGQGQQLLTGLLKKMVRRSTSSKGVKDYQTRVLISGYDEFISASATSVYIKINDYVRRKGNKYLN